MNVTTLHSAILGRFAAHDAAVAASLAETRKMLAYDLLPSTITELKRRESELVVESKSYTVSMFLALTCDLVDDYFKILNTPVNLGCPESKRAIDSQKAVICEKYIKIVSGFAESKGWDVDLITVPTTGDACPCGNANPEEFETTENERVCLVCFAQRRDQETGITHRDYERANVVNKFAYSRVLHFNECIRQFQGKNACKIDPVVFERLDQKFHSHRLLIDSPNKTIRYSKITKDHILLFLRQLNYPNHYENAAFIYYTLTGKRVDDIEYLEVALLEDFRELSALYDQVHGKDKTKELKRKNFLSSQFILFQLLKNRGHDCRLEDFGVLKTVEKRRFHDDVCGNLFQILGWKFTPTF